MDSLELTTDVLVIGGGLGGGWAAAAAARTGADVIVVEKGYFGTSGVTATAGPGHWWVPPDPKLRRAAIEERAGRAFGLAEPEWMERIIDTTWRILPTLAPHYEFPRDPQGQVHYRGLRGPEYLRALREQAALAGVHILDHSPALELLLHSDGSVAGARGVQRQVAGGRSYTIRAGAVILATGGCAFRSKLLGSHNNTGDGYLMGVEAGAELSGMELSNYHTVALAHTSQTRSAQYSFADFFDCDGQALPTGSRSDYTSTLAKALLRGPVYATLARMPEDLREAAPHIQPAMAVTWKRMGIDPYSERFEITLHGEGTVRGIGGLRVASDACETNVSGLYAAGDAASRELIAGATSGGGAQNSSWSLSSGVWSGQAAAARARSQGRRSDTPVRAAGRAGLQPQSAALPRSDGDLRALVEVVKDELLPYDKVMFRHGARLARSLDQLDAAWADVRDHVAAEGITAIAAREAAALIASARWSYRAAAERRESRGMHQREDFPHSRHDMARRLVVGGLDRIWTRFEGEAVSSGVHA